MVGIGLEQEAVIGSLGIPKARISDNFWKAERRFSTRYTQQHSKASAPREETIMQYAVVIEKANGNYSAYVPDLPGCIATGKTKEEVKRNISDAMRMHVNGLKDHGITPPAANNHLPVLGSIVFHENLY